MSYSALCDFVQSCSCQQGYPQHAWVCLVRCGDMFVSVRHTQLLTQYFACFDRVTQLGALLKSMVVVQLLGQKLCQATQL